MPVHTELPADSTSDRRVVALVLPALLCELAEPRGVNAAALRRRAVPQHALGVVLSDSLPANRERPANDFAEAGSAEPAQEEIVATSVLSAVNDAALRLGVRAGQTLAEARALAARLIVRRVARTAIDDELGRIAEIALAFGATVSFEAPDTVWVDVTGSAHLFGGEAALVAELVARVREAGHRVRAALAAGPRLAQAFARAGDIGKEGYLLVPSAHTKRELANLPIRVLGLPLELESWLIRLGVLTLGELAALPESALAARLEEHAVRVFSFLSGNDTTPLVAYTPPRVVFEQTSFEEAVTGSEPLLFVLRGLASRMCARLSGRGEAARGVVLDITADAAVARFKGVARTTRIRLELPKPLWRSDELNRTVASKLERLQLAAPSIGVRLEVTELTEAVPRQLELGLWGSSATAAVDELPIVLAELAADIGKERVGVLRAVDAHRPELASELVPALPDTGGKARAKKARRRTPAAQESNAGGPSNGLVHRLTRLLPEPVPLETPLRKGATVALGRRLYTIESLRFEQRLDSVEWWNRSVHRDYVKVSLRGTDGVVEGLVYVDRESGRRYWQAVAD